MRRRSLWWVCVSRRTSAETPAEIAALVGRRTVYSYAQIEDRVRNGEVLVVLFRQDRVLREDPHHAGRPETGGRRTDLATSNHTHATRRSAMASAAIGRVALFSIHPQYAEAILAGTKSVEFRRTPLADDVTHVVVYATAPTKMVVGIFEVDGGRGTQSVECLAQVQRCRCNREDRLQRLLRRCCHCTRDQGPACAAPRLAPYRSPRSTRLSDRRSHSSTWLRT